MHDEPPITPPTAEGQASRTLFGKILYSIGLLIMGLSGLCTGACFIAFVPNLMKNGGVDALGMLGVGAVFGGLPFGFGFFLFWLGKKMTRPEVGQIPPHADTGVKP